MFIFVANFLLSSHFTMTIQIWSMNCSFFLSLSSVYNLEPCCSVHSNYNFFSFEFFSLALALSIALPLSSLSLCESWVSVYCIINGIFYTFILRFDSLSHRWNISHVNIFDLACQLSQSILFCFGFLLNW